MRTRLLATTLTAVLLLTGCSGGDDPEGGSGEPSGEAAAPTEAEYDEAHDIYHDLADDLDAAGAAAAEFQAAVKKARDRDPEGFADSPAVAAAFEEQAAAVADREAALAELAGHPAMADEELAAAYEEFATRYAEAMAYQDGYNDSYPVFLASQDVCQAVFGSGPEDASSFGSYAKEWLRMQRAAATACQETTSELAGSGNEDVVALAERWDQVIEERLAAIERFAQRKLSGDQALKLVEKANNAFLEDYERLSGFSDRLGELMPIDAYEAMDPIFEDRLGETDEPSDEPSDESSDEAGEDAE